MRIIIGLGNPEEKYKYTRHNAGFLAIDELAKKYGRVWQENKKLKSAIAKSSDAVLIKPMTFMNESGQAVQAVLSYFKLLPKKATMTGSSDLTEILTVFHDELDLPLGKYKISVDSRSAGHNGVQSIIDCLKTKNFRRIRIGIGTPESKIIPAEKYVLQKFKAAEIKIVEQVIQNILSEL